MYSSTPTDDICHQTFKSGLPLLPLFSPLSLGSLHTLDWVQWQQQLDCCGTNYSAISDLQGSPSSDTSIREHPDGTLNHSDTDSKYSKDENHAIKPDLASGLSTGVNSCEEQISTAPQNNNSESSTCHESNRTVMHLPPVHDVGAFHAYARIVEVLAPAMQRGSSHCAEVVEMTESGEKYDLPTSPSSTSVIDLEFLSLSPLFSSQHDDALLSPSWKLDLTLSSSWHLAAESAISLSQPVAQSQGSSLVRRPATRRKCLSHPNSPKSPIQKSPYMNGSRTLSYLSQKRSPSGSGILRATNSPLLKSHGYRVRFEEMETR